MFAAGFVLGFLECRVANVYLALFAPEPGLVVVSRQYTVYQTKRTDLP